MGRDYVEPLSIPCLIANAAVWFFAPAVTLRLLERELWLSENISSVIRYSHPRDLALELLAVEGGQ